MADSTGSIPAAPQPALETVKAERGPDSLSEEFEPLEDDEALEALRDILIDHYRQRVTAHQTELEDLQEMLALLEEQVNDTEALIATITPVMSDAISSSIRRSQDEMIEALYPIAGRLASKAVTESMRDLARSIDSQMRDMFSVENLKRRLRARISGVPDAEMMIRTSLPFQAEEIFLIHRESGLLIAHLSSNPDLGADSDLISGMLTAIRDFVQDAFGHGSEGQLDSIQYGNMQILIEAGRYAYLAAVVHGYEPTGYRSQLRDGMHEIGSDYFKSLRNYDGDASQLEGVKTKMQPLLVTVMPELSDVSLERSTTSTFYTVSYSLLWAGLALFTLLISWRLWILFSG